MIFNTNYIESVVNAKLNSVFSKHHDKFIQDLSIDHIELAVQLVKRYYGFGSKKIFPK